MKDDRELELSYHLNIETVPTLIACEDGVEQERLVGWLREDWGRLTGIPSLGANLPEFSPGCGSRTVELWHAGKARLQIWRHGFASAPH